MLYAFEKPNFLGCDLRRLHGNFLALLDELNSGKWDKEINEVGETAKALLILGSMGMELHNAFKIRSRQITKGEV